MSGLTQEQILEKLTLVFRDVLDDDTLTLSPDTTASDIEEWDSLSQIKIILACEKMFDIHLNARDINTLENVGAMLDLLHGLNV